MIRVFCSSGSVRMSSCALRRRIAPGLLVVLCHLAVAAPGASAQDLGEWSAARSVDLLRKLGVNSSANDGCPYESPDGRTLYFASQRNPNGSSAAKDLDIWVASRRSDAGQWRNAAPLPAPVNTGAMEFCPTPLPGNQLLFVSTRSNNCGGNLPNADIYYTRLELTPVPHWVDPVPLPCGVNSGSAEFSPSLVEAGGRTWLFFSSNRHTGSDAHKLYVTELLADNTWSDPQQIAELGSGGSDARPNVRADGLEIVFDSNRAGSFDIYRATRETVDAPWGLPEALGPQINDPAADETRPSLSRDGTRLYFGSTRANAALGGTGGDIYVSTRRRMK